MKLTDPFEISAYTANMVDLVYINLTDKQRDAVLKLVLYTKAIKQPPALVRNRAHSAFKKAARQGRADLDVAPQVYEHTLSGVLDMAWNSLSEDEQYRRLYQLKMGK